MRSVTRIGKRVTKGSCSGISSLILATAAKIGKCPVNVRLCPPCAGKAFSSPFSWLILLFTQPKKLPDGHCVEEEGEGHGKTGQPDIGEPGDEGIGIVKGTNGRNAHDGHRKDVEQ